MTRVRRNAALWLGAILATAFPGPQGGVSPAAAFTIMHHDLAVTLRLSDGTLAGIDTLTIDPVGAAAITLHLAGGTRVHSVTAGEKAVPHSFRDGTLTITVPEGARQGEWQATVTYEAAFKDPVPRDPVNFEDPGFGVSGTISARGVFLDAAAGWYPAAAVGRQTFHLTVDADAGVEAVTAGTLLRRGTVEGRSVSEWDVREPLDGIALSAGKYIVREKSAGKVTLYTYFLPGNDPLSGKYLAACAKYIELYTRLLGPYPFGKFAVVENFFPTGYGFPSYTLLGSTVVALPFIIDTSLGHEIAHSWWGNGVAVDYGRGNWSEGLTTYVADYLYKEMESPAEGREYRLRLLREYATLVPTGSEIPLKEFSGRMSAATRAVGYGKAAMVFHMVRRMIGDEAFWKGLRRVARDKMFQSASWSDFDRAFAREAHVDLLSFREGSVDLSSFFRQWTERAGAPVLSLDELKATRVGNGWKVSGRLVQEKPYYELSVPVRLESDGKNVDATLALNGRDIRFALYSDKAPRRFLIDPDVDVFRRLDPREIPPIVNGIKGSGSLLVVAARGIPPAVTDASRTLLESLGKGDVRIVREADAPPERLAGHDILYIGVPEGTGYLPPLPAGLKLSPSSFTIAGKAYAEPGDALFAVLPHPSSEGRVCAVFLPLSGKAAYTASRKITHYGKYSFLAFRDGANQARGTWPPGASAAVFEFPVVPE